MGADLYIKDLPRDKQITGFQTSVKDGYFRDSYNNSDLLWQFDLSWWDDITKRFCNEEGEMTPEKSQALLDELKDKEPIFEKNMQDLIEEKNRVWDYVMDYKTKEEKLSPASLTDKERLEEELWYRGKYKQLQEFLAYAIKLNSPIECSL